MNKIFQSHKTNVPWKIWLENQRIGKTWIYKRKWFIFSLVVGAATADSTMYLHFRITAVLTPCHHKNRCVKYYWDRIAICWHSIYPSFFSSLAWYRYMYIELEKDQRAKLPSHTLWHSSIYENYKVLCVRIGFRVQNCLVLKIYYRTTPHKQNYYAFNQHPDTTYLQSYNGTWNFWCSSRIRHCWWLVRFYAPRSDGYCVNLVVNREPKIQSTKPKNLHIIIYWLKYSVCVCVCEDSIEESLSS